MSERQRPRGNTQEATPPRRPVNLLAGLLFFLFSSADADYNERLFPLGVLQMAKRVLVCDDEPAIADLISQYFEALGCEVSTFTDAVKGFKTATEEDFCLITLDLMMPGMNGSLAMNSISMIKPDATILLITGLDESHEMVQDARNKGPNIHVLHKPFTLDMLGKTLENLGI